MLKPENELLGTLIYQLIELILVVLLDQRTQRRGSFALFAIFTPCIVWEGVESTDFPGEEGPLQIAKKGTRGRILAYTARGLIFCGTALGLPL